MAQKRKMEISAVDEMEKNLFSIFQNAAYHVSQLYTTASNEQKTAFVAGKKHALFELIEWLDKKQEEVKVFSPADLRKHLQDEIGNYVNGARLEDKGYSNCDRSSAVGEKQSESASSSSVSGAQDLSNSNIQDMEVEINSQDMEVNQHMA